MKKIIGFFDEKDVIFHDKDSNFFITNFELGDGTRIKIKGQIEGGFPENLIELKIRKEEEYKGQKTYIIEKEVKYHIPDKKPLIIKYIINLLNVSLLQGEKIYNFYTKDDTLSFFEELDKDEDKEQIKEIPKLFRKEEKYEDIIDILINEKYRRKVRVFLFDYGFTETQIKKILEDEYLAEKGEEIIEEIQKNPYNLLLIKGITFKQIDNIFLKAGGSPVDQNRIYSGILYYLQEKCLEEKGTYIEVGELMRLISSKLNVTFQANVFASYLKMLQPENKKDIKDLKLLNSIKVLKYDNKYWVFLHNYYLWEQYIVQRVKNLLDLNEREGKEKIEIDEFVENGKQEKKEPFVLEEEHKKFGNIIINEDQIRAIENCFNYKFSIIRGYGGTGKSTIIKKIVDIAREKELTFTLLAPTGKAVDVLINASGAPTNCFTIHKKLQLLEEGKINDKELVEIKEDIILIDESSMISTPLMYSLLQCIGPYKTVVFLGDDNQLRPVGIGEPFLKFIESKLIPETHLTKVYRQKEGSLILENSRDFAEMKPIKYHNSHDWTFFDIKGYNEENLLKLVEKEVNEFGFNIEKDIVISAKYKGDCGIDIINKKIQEKIQKDNKFFFEKGYQKFYLGDRVMNLSNTYINARNIHSNIFGLPLDIITSKKKYDRFKDRLIHLVERDRDVFKKITYNKKTKMFFYVDKEEDDEGEEKLLFEKIAHYDEDNSLIFKEEEVSEVYTPEVSLFNGNYGKIVAIKDKETGEWNVQDGKKFVFDESILKEYCLLIDFGDKLFFVNEADLKNITLFYASTVHKMQGSQFDKVYGICSPRDFFMIDRNWLYTMMSRAKNKFIFFSNENTVKKVQFKQGVVRKSFIGIFLYQLFIDKEKNKL